MSATIFSSDVVGRCSCNEDESGYHVVRTCSQNMLCTPARRPSLQAHYLGLYLHQPQQSYHAQCFIWSISAATSSHNFHRSGLNNAVRDSEELGGRVTIGSRAL